MDNAPEQHGNTHRESRNRSHSSRQGGPDQDDYDRSIRISHAPAAARNQSTDRTERFPTFRPTSRTTSPGRDLSRVTSRDYAGIGLGFTPSHHRIRVAEPSFVASSLRRRVGSTISGLGQSPGPTYSWRDHGDSSRRSIAVGPQSHRETDAVSRKLSLAGFPTIDTVVSNQPYVDPGYTALNPAYEQPANARPVWGLAKPLPHVLRPGMVPTKDELEKEFKQEVEDQQHSGEIAADIESGRIDSTLRPDRITSQLDAVRREREISLFRAYRHGLDDTPVLSPFGMGRRRGSDAPTETQEYHRHAGDTFEEENESVRFSEIPHLELPQLREAIEEVDKAHEEVDMRVPYQDAVPLPAYDAEDDEVHNLHTYWSVVRLYLREPLAEFVAVMVMDVMGFSVNCAIFVTQGRAGTADAANWAWGFAAMMAIYIAGGVSGAQLNPAVSFMLYVYRGFPLRKIPPYAIAQVSAAFVSCLIVYGIFHPGIVALQQERALAVQAVSASTSVVTHALPPITMRQIVNNFIGGPRQEWVDMRSAFLTEMVGTALLVISVLALGDDQNAPPGAGMNAFIVALLVVVLSMAFGSNTGIMMNPVRDFGPRVAMTLLGYGREESLFADGYWFLVGWLGPFSGALIGGFIYDAAIFVGGESPVNYPAKRIRRAARKWRKRWKARMRRTRKAVRVVKDDVVHRGYEAIDG